MKDDGGRIDENESDRREGSHQMFLRVVYPGKMALRFKWRFWIEAFCIIKLFARLFWPTASHTGPLRLYCGQNNVMTGLSFGNI